MLWDYPLVMTNIANGKITMYSGFVQKKGYLNHTYILNYQRVNHGFHKGIIPKIMAELFR